MKKILFIILLFTVCIIPQNVPEIHQYATDLTGTLSNDQINQLNYNLKSYEDTTSNQIVVLVVSTLNDEPIEDYAYNVAAKNKVGSKRNDNGVLLLVAKVDKKLRIEVGYGLEGVLPDALTSSIIRNSIAPHFKDGDYYGGIAQGLEDMKKAIAGEYKITKPQNTGKTGMTIFSIIMMIIIMILSMFRGNRRRGFTYWSGMGGMGGFGGGGGWGGGSSGGGFGGFSGGGGSFGGGGSSGSW